MAGGYDEMTDRSYPRLPRRHVAAALAPRPAARTRWRPQGFTVYEAEWWHFDYQDWRRYRIQNLTFEQLSSAAHGQ